MSINKAFSCFSQAQWEVRILKGMPASVFDIPESGAWELLWQAIETRTDAATCAASFTSTEPFDLAMKAWMLRGCIEADADSAVVLLADSLCTDLAKPALNTLKVLPAREVC